MQSTSSLKATLSHLKSIHPSDDKEQFELAKTIFELQIKVDEMNLIQKRILWIHLLSGCGYGVLGILFFLLHSAPVAFRNYDAIFIFAPCFLVAHIGSVIELHKKRDDLSTSANAKST